MKTILTAVAATLILGGVAQAELTAATDAVVRQSLASGKPTLIDLGARTCQPCREMAPILESLAKEHHGNANVLFIDVNKDEAAAEKFRVQMIPTQVFFNAQGKEVKRHIGFLGKTEIVRELKAAGLK